MKNSEILKVQNLSISFKSKNTLTEVINNVSFNVLSNEILAIVGESGSGKSVSSLSIMGLLPKVISKVTNGSILFEGKELLQTSNKEFQNIRGNEISMVFQEPMSSLNPSMTCGKQVAELIKKHQILSKSLIKEEVLSLFKHS